MSQTSRLGLGFLEPGQAQKEFTHNEALRLIDIVAAAAVESVGSNAPPASPMDGQCFIVGTAPTGAWVGHAKAIAGYAPGGWRFVEAITGMSALDKASGQTAAYDGTAWSLGTIRGASLRLGASQVVGPRLAAVANPSGGTAVDVEARAAIVAILDRMRTHGLIA
ncbi:MAG: DUF2793 domain-containing protein [Sphingomicrobium sp.]